MNKLTATLTFLALSTLSTASFADVSVDGYTRSNGTYVEPYHRTNPDGDKNDNWSTKGNTNPYTGEEGTRNPSVDGTDSEDNGITPHNNF